MVHYEASSRLRFAALLCLVALPVLLIPTAAMAQTITSLSPNTAVAGSGGFTLTVNGSGFFNNWDTVLWNGSARTTTYVNSGRLTATISTADIATAGTVNVTVSPNFGGDSNAVTFTITASSYTVSGTVTLNGGGYPSPGATIGFTGGTTAVSSTTDGTYSRNGLTGTVTATPVLAGYTFSPANYTGITGAIANRDFTAYPTPVINSLSQSTATAGDSGFTLHVLGTGFATGAQVMWGAASPTTTRVSSTELTIPVATSDLASAGSVSVTVTIPSGGVSNAKTFTINPYTVTGHATLSGGGLGGVTMTITGTGTTATTATGTGAYSIGGLSGSHTVTPSLAGYTFSPAVSTSFSTTATGVDFTASYAAPTLTSLSSTSATAGATGFTLTLTGLNFLNGVSQVQWDGQNRLTTYISPTQVSIAVSTADLASADTIPVTVTNPAPGGGTSSAINFTINNPLPTINSGGLSPSTVYVGGLDFVLTVTGTNFVSTSVVNWGGSPRATTYGSATSLTALITAADIAATGSVNVTVTNPGPGGGTSVRVIAVAINNPVPTIGSGGLSPNNAYAGGPAFTLTVNGTNFVPTSVVRWNGNASGNNRATTYVSATQLTAAITAADIAAIGTPSVYVFNPTPGGGLSGALTFTINTNPAPTVSTLSPASATAGTAAFTLTVSGSNFVPASKVKWNGSSRVTTYVSATQLKAAISAADIATVHAVNVTVTNPSPGGGTSGSVGFTINNPVPVVNALSPSSANMGGAAFTLTVTGMYFVATSQVMWNGTGLTTSYVSSTKLKASVPALNIAATGTASITVTSPTPGGGTSTPAATFTINSANPVPTITTLSPSSAFAGGAAFTLTVNGTGFIPGSVVKWNSSSPTTTYVSANQLTAAIPASYITATGTPSVTVVNTPGGTSNGSTFTITNGMPTITSISPNSATAGGGSGFTLTVYGTNFDSNSVVWWKTTSLTTSHDSSTQMHVTIPSSYITSAGTATVTVVNPSPGGGTSNGATFTISSSTLTITSISPSVVYAGDLGFTLTVNGTGFISSGTTSVRWNGTSSGNALTTTYVSPTQVTAAVPASDITTAGSASVYVHNSGGTNAGPLTLTISARPTPAISSITPSIAGAGGPAFTLTVNGTNFIPTSTVNWNGSARATTYVSATQLTAAITAADISAIATPSVTVVNGALTSNSVSFAITDPYAVLTYTGDLNNTYGAAIAVSALLTAGTTSTPIPGVTVTIIVGGYQVQGTTDANGKVSGTVPANVLLAGTYPLYCYSAATLGYPVAEASASVVVSTSAGTTTVISANGSFWNPDTRCDIVFGYDTTLTGSLSYTDTNAGITIVAGNAATVSLSGDKHTATITGSCTVNGTVTTFTLVAVDSTNMVTLTTVAPAAHVIGPIALEIGTVSILQQQQ